MKLLFVWWFKRAHEIYPYWRDGLKAALEYLGREHEVDMFFGEEKPPTDTKYDAILFWGDSNCPFFQHLSDYRGKKGMILTTDPQNIENLRRLDVVFCESNPVYEACRKYGIRAKKAFGTDTDFYKPNWDVEKDIPYFYPATFSPWKRQRDIAHLGKELYCVGTIQPDGQEEYEICKKAGVNIAVGYFQAKYIRYLYRRAKKVLIPALHGSERTVLEAMACGIVPEVTNPANIRAQSYLDEYRNASQFIPQDFILRNYSYIQYAENILKGFEV